MQKLMDHAMLLIPCMLNDRCFSLGNKYGSKFKG
jgi:hypothetical protein